MSKNKPTYYTTVVQSPQWQAWENVAHEHGFDWHESVECGWLSPEHFQAFLVWYFNEGKSTLAQPISAKITASNIVEKAEELKAQLVDNEKEI